ncbi:unnamed protein product [Symbiodinium sp. CCMP2456]|nr:unnamed protein product [Symbiodinium sp. CCMP2456]
MEVPHAGETVLVVPGWLVWLGGLVAHGPVAMREVVLGTCVLVGVWYSARRLWSKLPQWKPAAKPGPLPVYGPAQASLQLEDVLVALSDTIKEMLPPMLETTVAEAVQKAMPPMAASSSAVDGGETLQECLPRVLADVLPAMVMEAVAKAIPQSAQSDGDGTTAILAVDTLSIKTLFSNFTDTNKKNVEGLLQAIHKSQLQDLKKEFETLQNSVNQIALAADKNAIARFTTLDGAMKKGFQSLEQGLAGRVEACVAKLEGLADSLGDVGTKLESQCHKLEKQGDRIESMLREKLTSLQADVNRLLGELNQQGRDMQSTMRRNTQSVDSAAQAVASMGAGFSAPPLDSSGVKETVQITQNLAVGQEEVLDILRTLRDRPAPTPPRDRQQTQEVPLATPVQMPTSQNTMTAWALGVHGESDYPEWQTDVCP